MNLIIERIQCSPHYQEFLKALARNERLPGLGLPRAARLPFVAALQRGRDRPIVLVTDRADHALSIYDELGFWAPDTPRYLFSEPNPLFYENAAWGSTTRRERLAALTSLAHYHLPFGGKPPMAPVIVSSARAAMTFSMPRRDFLKACKKLSVGQTLKPETLLHQWVQLGYKVEDTVIEAGQVSRRGGILDIWIPADSHPLRLDFFGDELESIRQFDPATQRTLSRKEFLLVTPAREFIAETPVSDDLTGISGTEESEFQIPLIYRNPGSLLDYLPPRSLVLIDDLGMVESMVSEVEEQAVHFRQECIDEGTLPPDFPVPYLTWSELFDGLQGFSWVELGHSTASDEIQENVLAGIFKHSQRFGGHLKPFMEHLLSQTNAGETVIVVSRQCERLKELWSESSDRGAAGENPRFIEGSLTEGFIIDDLHLVSDSEIFGWERPQPRTRQKPAAEAPEALFADLRQGDLVVHIDHGIGRYGGLVQRTLDGHEREFLAVEYENGDMVFVPVHQADRLTRYIGTDGGAPALSRLGGADWTTTKSRVREAVHQVAQELLDLYARRHVSQGYSFKPDTAWQKELEDSFPYIETEDQIQAIAEIKKDMESPRPMDRLLCGDVGYGKTEVALRAAFKAVMDGRQVAILVPTTVLAQQHYETFQQRLAAYPVTVEMLSRFRTHREQTEILRSLLLGKVDIVIGTHRLISQDVEFKDLGLVIIDEEQRFGVTHKEHLKKFRTEVDVLTLTATPIPRTLYMALTGVRDISNLNTPPEERLPIITHVGPYSQRLVRQAILRELERGGQVFFVHNRVQTIHSMKMHLERLVPEARIGIGHGQMPETELASVMHQFNEGEIDILLSTTIIESGLDIPNANTLIVDRADTFGLAQLYQLRGRVGRGAVRAYAYFFRHRKRPPTPDGQERLEVIAENSQLGAGYSIAMRDLEIRGAGELLGTRQSGHIASVGFHLYTRMLAAAVKALRKAAEAAALTGQVEGSLPLAALSRFPSSVLDVDIKEPVTVDLPLAVGIPRAYIPNQDLRLRLYRRLASLRDEREIDALASEFSDRFGPFPEMVENLFYQMRVKLRADVAGLTSVSAEGGLIVLRFPALSEGMAMRSLPDLGPQVRGGKNAYWCGFLKYDGWMERLLEVLEQIKERTVVLTDARMLSSGG
jgi:transcription-repair coupling factor (superfamily II helicase)